MGKKIGFASFSTQACSQSMFKHWIDLFQFYSSDCLSDSATLETLDNNNTKYKWANKKKNRSRKIFAHFFSPSYSIYWANNSELYNLWGRTLQLLSRQMGWRFESATMSLCNIKLFYEMILNHSVWIELENSDDVKLFVGCSMLLCDTTITFRQRNEPSIENDFDNFFTSKSHRLTRLLLVMQFTASKIGVNWDVVNP